MPRGIRWYEDGRLTRRFVFADDSGSWSLSPDGAGPVVTWVAQGNWQNVDVDADASEETWPTTSHGMQFRLTAPDGKLIFQFSGLERPAGPQPPIFTGTPADATSSRDSHPHMPRSALRSRVRRGRVLAGSVLLTSKVIPTRCRELEGRDQPVLDRRGG
jgi:FtsP/CotA-like multicopper oxidase with cupredoxin domain